jgi:hypothetical protein
MWMRKAWNGRGVSPCLGDPFVRPGAFCQIPIMPDANSWHAMVDLMLSSESVIARRNMLNMLHD